MRASATHRDPRCAHQTYAEILLRHYRGQLHSLDIARNIVIYRMLPRKTKIVQRNTWDCLDVVCPHAPHTILTIENELADLICGFTSEIGNCTENYLDKTIKYITIIGKINHTKTKIFIIIIQ